MLRLKFVLKDDSQINLFMHIWIDHHGKTGAGADATPVVTPFIL
ncbi:MAG: hypothetical protein K0R36_1140 [Chryseobacterium sp.]|jgi:hypothetical protein|nr:hypothetical protein [Chryseobacterium sp.]